MKFEKSVYNFIYMKFTKFTPDFSTMTFDYWLDDHEPKMNDVGFSFRLLKIQFQIECRIQIQITN